MRLLIATPLYPPDPGGPATYAKALEEGLPGKNIEVVLVKYSNVRDRPRFLRHLVYSWFVFRAALGADLVLALDPVSTGLPAFCGAWLARKPFLVKVVGDYAWEQGRQRFGVWQSLDEFVQTKEGLPLPVVLLRRVELFVAKRARRVIVPSEYLKRIVSRWGVDSERITVIPNAEPSVAPGTLPPQLADLPRPRIITVARLVPWKGIHGLMTAMVRIRATYPDAQLIVVGDGPERAELERYAELRLKEGYIFTGALDNGATLAAMATSDIFVLNSTYEGLSHVLLEALALGKAIVATRAGGNPEVIEDRMNGLLISIGDADGLAQACVSILADAEYRARLESAAKASASRYAPERMLEATATLLTAV